MATIVHFDIPADEPARARSFYAALFGWKFNVPPGYPDFSLIETTGPDGRPGIGGGLGRRGEPGQTITLYFGVEGLESYLPKVRSAGGTIVMPPTVVPGYGVLAICMDTEGNRFGLWEETRQA